MSWHQRFVLTDRSNLFLSIRGKFWPRRANRTLDLNSDEQSLTIDGRTISLTHKAWRVITALIEAAPAEVSREQLIQTVWDGNFAVGEKGLNHALWVIRTRLNDDAAHPKLIRTIPRSGYQWIGPAQQPAHSERTRTSKLVTPFALGLVGVGLAALLLPVTQAEFSLTRGYSGTAPESANPIVISDANGHRAYAAPKSIIVRHVEGCRFEFLASENKTFGLPIFSTDGKRIAIPVTQNKSCSMAVIEFKTRTRTDYQSCPDSRRT